MQKTNWLTPYPDLGRGVSNEAFGWRTGFRFAADGEGGEAGGTGAWGGIRRWFWGFGVGSFPGQGSEIGRSRRVWVAEGHLANGSRMCWRSASAVDGGGGGAGGE